MAIKISRETGRPSNVELALEGWAVDLANWMVSWQHENDRIASGKSLELYEVKITKSNEVELLAASYWVYIFAGRGAGGFPPPDNIKQWIKDKPISFNSNEISLDQLAFLIGRSIAESGTKPPYLTIQNFNMVVNQLGSKYLQRISTDIAQQFSKNITEAFTKDSRVFTKKK